MLLRNISVRGLTYEWEENLPTGLSKDIDKTIDTVFTSTEIEESVIKVPVDVTQSGSKLQELIEGGRKGILIGFIDFFQSGGLIMYPLFIIALISFILMIERILFYVRTNKKGNIILSKVPALVENKKLKEALEVCEANQSSVSTIISPLINDKLDREKAENILDESFSEGIPILQKRLPTLAVLSAVAPLLGLLGTVSGMIALFDVITIYGTSNPKILAGGISIALVTTQTGLSIAIPIMLVHHVLSRVKTSITHKIEQASLHILNCLYPSAAK